MTLFQQSLCIIGAIILLAVVFIAGTSYYSRYIQREGQKYILNLVREAHRDQSLRHLNLAQIQCFFRDFFSLPQQYINPDTDDDWCYVSIVDALLLTTSQLGRDASLQFGWRASVEDDASQNPGQPVLWLLFSDEHKRRFVLQVEQRGFRVLPLEAFTDLRYGFITLASQMNGAEITRALNRIYNT